jgi:transposase
LGEAADCRPRPVEPQYGIIAEAMSPMVERQQHKHTMSKNLLYLGLDVHAQTVAIAIAEANGEVRNYGSVSNDLGVLEKTMRRIKNAHPGCELRVCYEAGPTGFVIARRCAQLGIDCAVVAPSLIPSRAGDRVKTDRRDAVKLARLHRAGELTAVNVPNACDEAMRDLCRARTDAVQDLRRSRAQLKAFLLRNGYRYSGKSSWTEAHRRYLRELVLPHGAQRVVLEDSLRAITTAEERIERLEDQMEALLESWEMKPVVEALMGLRGFQIVGAMVLVSELGGAWRFDHPRQLMKYLGLVPTEDSSGPRRRQGGITKAGNSHARWLLIEAAQHYRLPPKISKELSKRQEHLSKEIKACSWKAQTRLHSRMMRLSARGKLKNKVTVAVARELAGFVWAIFRLMEPQMKSAAKTEAAVVP